MKKLLLSFLFSIAFIWIVSALFIDTIEPYEWSPTLEKYVRVAGTVNQERNEGWGASTSGTFGIHGIPDILDIRSNKIAIWGDSFVEAIQVDDNKKMAQVFTEISRKNGMNMMAFGLGVLGGGVVDYYFDIPKYEDQIDAIKAHFIVINHRRDVLPDEKKRKGSRFVSDPEFNFIFDKRRPRGSLFQRKLIYDFNLNFVFALAKSRPDLKHLRFSLGTASPKKRTKKPQIEVYDEQDALDFMFSKLKKQTTLPLIFVYVPRIPTLVDGHFDFTDKEASFMHGFEKKCQEEGVAFISLESEFLAFHESTGEFHNGFTNSRPGSGHLNQDGHRLVANAIFDYVLEAGLN